MDPIAARCQFADRAVGLRNNGGCGTDGRLWELLELAFGAVTDTGLRRARNEDAFIAEPPVFAVADGMGGHSLGDVASALVVESLRSVAGTTPSRSDVLDAVRLANEAIGQVARERTQDGMGTTVCGLAATGDQGSASLLAFNVGDSRVYRLDGSALRQVSTDHSVVQELLDSGQISAAEAATHPERHVVTRSLGGGEAVEIDWWQLDPVAGSRFLLCSDGLVKEIAPEQIAITLTQVAAPQAAAEQLLALALEAGGRDNITVVVVDVVRVTVDQGGQGLDDDTNPRLDVDGPTFERTPTP
jgi:protein phosphatase